MAKVIDRVRQTIGLGSEAEITLELNPEGIDEARLSAFYQAGVNRLSIGAQSFSSTLLDELGRGHRAEEIQQTVERSREVGFQNISLDLIYGAYGQRMVEALADLEAALALAPEHLSLYQLTIEAQTSFGLRAARGEALVLPEEEEHLVSDALRRHVEAAGYRFYEISNAARVGFEAVHNRLHWSFESYLALGVGAHGFLHNGCSGLRWANLRQPEAYLARIERGLLAEESREIIDAEALQEERILVGFRLSEGFAVQPEDRHRFGERAARLSEEGLLIDEGGRWRASEAGRPLLDYLWRRILVG